LLKSFGTCCFYDPGLHEFIETRREQQSLVIDLQQQIDEATMGKTMAKNWETKRKP
jgi:regulator of RNase E activity RraA